MGLGRCVDLGRAAEFMNVTTPRSKMKQAARTMETSQGIEKHDGNIKINHRRLSRRLWQKRQSTHNVFKKIT